MLTGAFLLEFLTDGAVTALTGLSASPLRAPLPVAGAAVDHYVAPRLTAGLPLVLVHGFTPEGKDDPRAVGAAGLLARLGFDVVVPTVPGLAGGRLRPRDADAVVAAVAAAGAGPVRMVAVSVGAGPALLAAADPRVRDRIATMLVLGGYASALELLRFFLTGDYSFGTAHGHVNHDPALVRAFITANGELVDAPTRGALLAGDRQRVAAVLEAPPPDLRRLLDALSPAQVAPRVSARLVLVHGLDDRAVPYTESLRLAAARPQRTEVLLVGVVGHLEGPGGAVAWHRVADLLTLWGAVYRLFAAD